MKKILLFVVIVLFGVSSSKGQILRRWISLPILELNDPNFQNQLDTILFIDYSCTLEKKRIHIIDIEEKEPNVYSVSIILHKLSGVGSAPNTGIYRNNDKEYIIRERSNSPIFNQTKAKINFYYEMLIEPWDNEKTIYVESLSPFDPCMWFLSYDKEKLEVIETRGIGK